MNIYVHVKSSYLNRTSLQAASGYFLLFVFLAGPIQSLSQGADITNHTIFFYYIGKKSPDEKGKCSFSSQKIPIGRAVAMKYPELTHTPVPFISCLLCFLFLDMTDCSPQNS